MLPRPQVGLAALGHRVSSAAMQQDVMLLLDRLPDASRNDPLRAMLTSVSCRFGHLRVIAAGNTCRSGLAIANTHAAVVLFGAY